MNRKHPPATRGRRVGLARAISKLGYCSRSTAASLIRRGRVNLNGRLIRNPGSPVLEGNDRIEVDGVRIQKRATAYLMLNKPRGLVTTASDEKGRETVYSLLPPGQTWLAPVGRLDKASEGLLLLTNDTAWSARIQAPANHLDKTYHVQISSLADDQLIRTLLGGVCAKDGERLKVKYASLLRRGQKNCWLEIVLDEGRNRHIRRMFEVLDIEVLRPVRVAVGPLKLGSLAKGLSRELTREEKTTLDRVLGLSAQKAAKAGI